MLFEEVLAISLLGGIVLLGALSSLAALAVVIYALYHVLIKQEEMRAEEKILWAVVILFLNLLGALIYLIMAWSGYTGLYDEKELSELERLADLREKEAITEEEYQELKSDIIEDMTD